MNLKTMLSLPSWSPKSQVFAGLLTAACATLAPVVAWATGGDLGGDGTAESPYIVSDAADLQRIAEIVNGLGSTRTIDLTIELAKDIDLTGVEWKPIGTWMAYGVKTRHSLGGTFDGKGHTISGMTVASDIAAASADQNPTALFGAVGGTSGFTLRNLTVSGATVTGSVDCAVLVGMTSTGKNLIENCIVKNSSVVCARRSAAFIGKVNDSSSFIIRNSKVLDSSVEAIGSGDMVGGLVGMGQNYPWSAVGCTISNVTVTTCSATDPAGIVCGYANGQSVTLTDLTVGGNCGTTPLVGDIIGSSSASAPVEIRMDGDSSLDVASFYGTASGYFRVRLYSGKTTFNAPADQIVPGSKLSGPVEGWYTLDTSNIRYVSNDAELRAIATSINDEYTSSIYYDKYRACEFPVRQLVGS